MAYDFTWTDIENGEQANSVRNKINTLGEYISSGYNGNICVLQGITRTPLNPSSSSSTSATTNVVATNVVGNNWANEQLSGFIVPTGANWVKLYCNLRFDCTGLATNYQIIIRLHYIDFDNTPSIISLVQWRPSVTQSSGQNWGESFNIVSYPLNVLEGSNVYIDIISSYTGSDWYIDKYGYITMEVLG